MKLCIRECRPESYIQDFPRIRAGASLKLGGHCDRLLWTL